MEKKKGYIFICIAGLLWSTLGLFGNVLMGYNLTPEQVAFTRLFLGFLVLTIYSIVKNPSALKISKKGIIYSIMIGIVCQGLFNLCYFKAINSVGVCISAVLLYTSPLFLTVFSKVFYKENINIQKIVSLGFCFLGAVLAVTGGKLDVDKLNGLGLILGISAAITYALMPIISKDILKECSSITILIYGFLFGSIFMLPLAKPLEMLKYSLNPKILVWMLVLGIVPAALAYIFYVEGVAKGVELSIAGVIASVELISSVLIGWTVLGENFSIVKLIGLGFMVVSALIAVKASKQEEPLLSEEIEQNTLHEAL